MISLRFLLACFILLAAFFMAAHEGMGNAPVVPAERRPLPDFGLMLNEDGDFSFTHLDPVQSEANLRAMLGTLAGTPVRTLVHSVAAGSDIMLYPSTAGSVYGWRVTEAENSPPWDERMPILRAHAAAGTDAVRIAGEVAADLGLYFIPTYRMNDGHFVTDPIENPLTGEFWIEHQELTLGTSPVDHEPFRHLLDFSHPEVRAYRLSIIVEVIERYGDLMAGLQLDFLRHPLLFPPGTAAERAPLLTALIADVRHALNLEGAQQGKYLSLHVRIPPSLDNNRWAGLEIERWIEEGLVDVIVPSPAMTVAFDLPVQEFVAIAAPHDVAVYPAIVNRNQFSWPFPPHPDASAYAVPTSRLATPEQVRGAVANYLFQGANGIEVYNFNLPPTPLTADILQAAADPAGGDRVYAVTPAYWNDNEDAYEYRKQVPVQLTSTTTVPLRLMLAESGLSAGAPAPPTLRLGLSDFSADALIPSDLKHSGAINPIAGIADSIAASGWSSARIAESRYFQLEVSTGGLPAKLGSLSFAHRRVNANAPAYMTIRASVDGFQTHFVVYEGHLPADLLPHDHTIDLSGHPLLDGVIGTVTFRIYGGFHASGAGIWSLTNHSELGAIQVTAKSSYSLIMERSDTQGNWVPIKITPDMVGPDGRIVPDHLPNHDSLRLRIEPRS